MSKSLRAILLTFAACVSAASLQGQDLSVNVRIVGQTATVEGHFSDGYKRRDPDRLILLDDYAGVKDLAARFSDVSAKGIGDLRPLRKARSAEYVSDGSVSVWRYTVDLRPLQGSVAAAHTSWVSKDTGILMIDDLLPQEGRPMSARVVLEVPNGWTVYTAAPKLADGSFEVRNAEKGVFLLGRDVRRLSGDALELLMSGSWEFSDDAAVKAVHEIAASFTKMFGGPPPKSQVAILKFPVEVPLGQWEADTRGSTITIVSSDMPFASQSIQRLHEQLRHEMFHLWVPNGLNLSGNYDWFYEGFALYQSLKVGVRTNRITFENYLDTLSRAYLIDNFGSRRVSLIEASKNRFSGNNTQIYARGMLVAFLSDLALLNSSKGKYSTDDLVRELYQKYPLSSPRTDGNTAIIAVMKQHAELSPIADAYIAAAEAINWTSLLATAGIEATQNGRETALRVMAKPNGRQKAILDKLGYNNWRKMGSK